jgi:dipeptide transport system ATP-binding protein
MNTTTPANQEQPLQEHVLAIKELSVAFRSRQRTRTRVLEHFDLTLQPGQATAIVGESGSGKTVATLAVMGLLPDHATIEAQRLEVGGCDLLTANPRARRRLLGPTLAMIFQEPRASLNPSLTVGHQLKEAMPRGSSNADAAALLAEVGMPDPKARLRAWPHELSGGMAQRVLIAMAIARKPQVLFADEPTTALDVTVQAQILALLASLQQRHRMAMVFISHDLAVVSQVARHVLVLYAGTVVEEGELPGLFRHPLHPYTQGLIDALPGQDGLRPIPGLVPPPGQWPPGCRFAPRCPRASTICHQTLPPWVEADGSRARCHHPLHS